MADALLSRIVSNEVGLTVADFSKHGTEPSFSIAAVAEALRNNTNVVRLHVGRGFIDDVGASALSAMLMTNATLTDLDINNNAVGPVGAAALADALKGNATLTRLSLYGNRVRDEGVEKLAAGLLVNTSLTIINLSYNGIGDVGAGHMSHVLRKNTPLKELRMSFNDISCVGLGYLLKPLEKDNATLTRLHLSNNMLIDEEGLSLGLSRIGEMLAQNTTLKALHMCNSGIVDDEVKLWVSAGNTTLEELGLRANSLYCPSLVLLLSGLVGLKDLDVGCNSISNAGALAASELLPSLPKLERLVIDGNDDHLEPEQLESAWMASHRPAHDLILKSPARGTRSTPIVDPNPLDPITQPRFHLCAAWYFCDAC